MPRTKLRANAGDAGMTLLEFLAVRLGVSRRRAKSRLDERVVFVCGRRVWMARHIIKTGDTVEVMETAPTDLGARLRIIHEDDFLLAVDKPSGCVATGPDSVESRLRKQTGLYTLCAAHRLDRDTTGCLLFAKDPAVMPRLIQMFRARTVSKTYHALVSGRVAFAQRTLRMPLDGLSATTHVRRLRTGRTLSHVEVRIETGRTHQIRRHLAAVGYPVLGDKHYGVNVVCPPSQRKISRQMLHAQRLILVHPHTGCATDICAPVPEDFLNAFCIDDCRKKISKKSEKEVDDNC